MRLARMPAHPQGTSPVILEFVAGLTFKGLRHDGTQYAMRFLEKGGKSREIPVRADLKAIILAYVHAAGITDGPLFRTAAGKTGDLTANTMSGIDICRMMKRRLKIAGLPAELSPHSFCVTTVTDLLEQNTPLDGGQSYRLLKWFCPGFLT
jgi:integrase/recombinase XerD